MYDVGYKVKGGRWCAFSGGLHCLCVQDVQGKSKSGGGVLNVGHLSASIHKFGYEFIYSGLSAE